MPKTIVRGLSLATLLVAICTAALFAGHASAGAMFVVTKTADTADGTCDSDCSVREAFIGANAAGGGTIQIPAGTYLIAIPGGGEDASATGDFDITSAITVIGAGPDQTILDGANLDRVIDVRATGSLNISGLTIQHGKVGHGLVAGLRADGPLVMSNVHVVNNEGDGTDADGTTGGVSINHQALITDSIISNNKTTGNSVGGLAAADGSNVTIRNTMIEGNSDTGSFPLGGILLRGQATLDNVIVRNNTANGHEPVGGLFASGASVVTIMNSQFLNNETTGDAAVGGIFNLGEMSIWDTTVDGNKTAIGTDGVAGILSLPNDAKTNKLTLRRVIVSNNSALGNNTVGGAAIQTPADLGEVTIDHNSVTDNSTGGLKFFAANPVTLSRVKITNNSAGMVATGGLFVGGASHVTVTDSWIDHNTSAGSAEAGVDVIGGSVADFIRVGITNNSASGASATGGITVYQATGSLTNVTVSGNSVAGNATGGVYVDTGTLTIEFTTIDNNTAGNSLGVGGLTSYGTLHISNSIVGNNAGQNSCYFNTPAASEDHNIDAENDCGFSQPTDKHNTNPQLGSLGFSGGGFSPTEPISPNSPAVDAAGPCSLTEDQRIFPRPQGNGCDIGAFEVGSVATQDVKWGALKCANGPTADDALAMIKQAAGVTVATVAGSACPALGASVYVAGWFLHIGWGDFDCDGHVTVFDALAVLRGVAGIGYPSAKPCPKVGDTVQVSAGSTPVGSASPTPSTTPGATNTPTPTPTPTAEPTSPATTPTATAGTPSSTPTSIIVAGLNQWCWIALVSNGLVNGFVSSSCSPVTGPDYSCLSIGILFDCTASSFSYYNYNCNIIGMFAFCNASPSSTSYTCDAIGTIVFCTTSGLNAPNYDCTVVAALVSCTTSSLNDPSFSCLGVSTSSSCS